MLVLEPNAGLFALPKLNDEPPVLVPPKALLVLPKPPVELPKPVFALVEPPNSPPPVFVVLEPKGFDAGLLPKREPEVLAAAPKPPVLDPKVLPPKGDAAAVLEPKPVFVVEPKPVLVLVVLPNPPNPVFWVLLLEPKLKPLPLPNDML